MLRVTGVTSHNSRVHSAVRPSEPHREKGGRVKNGLEVKRSIDTEKREARIPEGEAEKQELTEG